MSYKNINFRVADNYAEIELSRPPVNVINMEMMAEIAAAIELADAEPRARAIVFSSQQRVFSAGVDVGEHMPELVASMIQSFHAIFRRMLDLKKPTIAEVGGAALGGGCELALFCDFVLASEDAAFGFPEIKLASYPPVAVPLLPLLVGSRRALEMIITGESISASEAQRIGLINKAVPKERLRGETIALIEKISALSGDAVALALKAFRRARSLAFEPGLAESERIFLDELMPLEDAREGLRSFLEKRKPVWHHSLLKR